jgi:hypothetical protein
MPRFARMLCACVLSLAAACGSSSKPPTGPTSAPVTLTDVFVSRHVDAAQVPIYKAWATVIAAGQAATVVDATVTLSGGAPSPLAHREPRVVPVPAGQNRVLQFDIPDRPGNPLYTTFQITLTVDDAAGHRGAAEASGTVKDFPVPDLTASADRTTLAAGETTTLRWRATGGAWSGGVTVVAFQSGGRVTGQFVRNLRLNGRLARTLEGAAGAGRSLTGTVPSDRFEPGPRFGCPVTIDARLSSDAMNLTGTFAGRCTLDGSREVSLQGRFEATRHENPYPSPF